MIANLNLPCLLFMLKLSAAFPLTNFIFRAASLVLLALLPTFGLYCISNLYY